MYPSIECGFVRISIDFSQRTEISFSPGPGAGAGVLPALVSHFYCHKLLHHFVCSVGFILEGISPLLQHFQRRLFKSSAPVTAGNLIFLCSNLFLDSIYYCVTHESVGCCWLESCASFYPSAFTGNPILHMSHSGFVIYVLYSLCHWVQY